MRKLNKMEKINIYLAAKYSRRKEMENYAKILSVKGYNITSTWVYGEEEGKSSRDIAILDYMDLRKANVCICFNEPYGSENIAGARHTEFGFAWLFKKHIILVGEREQIFHYLPKNDEEYVEKNISIDFKKRDEIDLVKSFEDVFPLLENLYK